jgi:hypothetical protein
VRRAAPSKRVPPTKPPILIRTPQVPGTRVPPVTGTLLMPTGTMYMANDLRPVLAKIRKENRLTTGRILVRSTTAQRDVPAFKLWATLEKGKVTEWQAVDTNGKNLQTTVAKKRKKGKRGRDGVYCRVCVYSPDGHKHCYEIHCSDVPEPKVPEPKGDKAEK